MADTKISALSAAAALGATDVIPAVQGGLGPFGVTGTQLAEYIRDTIGTALTAGSNVTLTVNDAGDTITVAAAAAAPHPGYIAGNFYLPMSSVVSAGTALTANSIRCVPFFLPQPVTITHLGVRITTASAGGNLKVALYANNATTGRPTGSALASTGNIATDSVTIISAAIAETSVTLQPGVYWMCAWADNATVVCRAQSAASGTAPQLIGSTTEATINNTSTGAAFTVACAKTYGAWPSMTSESFTEATGAGNAIIHWKAA